MNIPVLGRLVDERFLDRRRRSTSLAGIIGGYLAICLFAYRYYVNHVWSWDLFVVAITIVGIKLVLMGWYFLKD